MASVQIGPHRYCRVRELTISNSQRCQGEWESIKSIKDEVSVSDQLQAQVASLSHKQAFSFTAGHSSSETITQESPWKAIEGALSFGVTAIGALAGSRRLLGTTKSSTHSQSYQVQSSVIFGAMFANSAISKQTHKQFSEHKTIHQAAYQKALVYETKLQTSTFVKESFHPEFRGHLRSLFENTKHMNRSEAMDLTLDFMQRFGHLVPYRVEWGARQYFNQYFEGTISEEDRHNALETTKSKYNWNPAGEGVPYSGGIPRQHSTGQDGNTVHIRGKTGEEVLTGAVQFTNSEGSVPNCHIGTSFTPVMTGVEFIPIYHLPFHVFLTKWQTKIVQEKMEYALGIALELQQKCVNRMGSSCKRCSVYPNGKLRGSQCAECVPGYYVSDSGGCTRCPVNHICLGSTSKVPCPPHQWTEGKTGQKKCEAKPTQAPTPPPSKAPTNSPTYPPPPFQCQTLGFGLFPAMFPHGCWDPAQSGIVRDKSCPSVSDCCNKWDLISHSWSKTCYFPAGNGCPSLVMGNVPWDLSTLPDYGKGITIANTFTAQGSHMVAQENQPNPCPA